MAVIRERRATDLVLGHPLNMDDTEGPKAKEAAAFAALNVTPEVPHAQAVAEIAKNQRLIQRAPMLLPNVSTFGELFESWVPHDSKTHPRRDDRPTYCTAGFNLCDHYVSHSVRVRPEVWDVIESHRVCCTQDPGYFEIVNWGDGYARIWWKYNQIIGSKLLAVIEIRSITARSVPVASPAASLAAERVAA